MKPDDIYRLIGDTEQHELIDLICNRCADRLGIEPMEIVGQVLRVLLEYLVNNDMAFHQVKLLPEEARTTLFLWVWNCVVSHFGIIQDIEVLIFHDAINILKEWRSEFYSVTRQEAV